MLAQLHWGEFAKVESDIVDFQYADLELVVR